MSHTNNHKETSTLEPHSTPATAAALSTVAGVGALYGGGKLHVETVGGLTADGGVCEQHAITTGSGEETLIIGVRKRNGEIHVPFTQLYRPALGQHSLELPSWATVDGAYHHAARQYRDTIAAGVLEDTAKPLGALRPHTGVLTDTVWVWQFLIDQAIPEEIQQARVCHDNRDSNTHTHASPAFEKGNVVWLSGDQINASIVSGDITSGVTLAALMLFFGHRWRSPTNQP